jgi:predicted Rossmann fold flavoprotein
MFDVLVVGGGAAGFFAALAAAKTNPQLRIGLIEKSSKFLAKVAISGGGRCNVTHNAATIDALLAGYPRGARELKGAFLAFSHVHTRQWFEERGVQLVAEKDGRIFPISNSSQTIIDCLLDEAERLGVELFTNCPFNSMKQAENGWKVETGNGIAKTKKLILSPGGAVKEEHLQWAKALGISIRLPVPSLFSFDIRDKNLNALSGLSVPNGFVTIAKEKPIGGPVLITHWGLSGPAVLKASAWHARKLHEWDYKLQLKINWCGLSLSDLNTFLDAKRKTNGGQTLVNKLVPSLPNRLWQR